MAPTDTHSRGIRGTANEASGPIQMPWGGTLAGARAPGAHPPRAWAGNAARTIRGTPLPSALHVESNGHVRTFPCRMPYKRIHSHTIAPLEGFWPHSEAILVGKRWSIEN